ncbi:cell wall integrity and stress response component 3-like [Nasonia vitripennis]|uniref:Uncharacterized protein n=1 Tax=Nasonia vitripennis TaxID=7425 RepID=A0A7M7QMZ5_NASVI|nr:cell wall integrity and stress response component 3-like [Nasonia vitripennis]XP_031789126.1 cell wall integrity and stress response component 3-like [Nasonia vitripennis]XP_031789127.1 cell wall integrity and stress response component 3-like [Nasonia vitripennis]XP_031789128.1 cell wall integrity and stress response component 3-like [Nasonia vitripennis]XP_031789151.1 cell wall integrity and stress response component 3-like [Nasonia vitripennis]XP_031789152.1 cell wall integrity and stress
MALVQQDSDHLPKQPGPDNTKNLAVTNIFKRLTSSKRPDKCGIKVEVKRSSSPILPIKKGGQKRKRNSLEVEAKAKRPREIVPETSRSSTSKKSIPRGRYVDSENNVIRPPTPCYLEVDADDKHSLDYFDALVYKNPEKELARRLIDKESDKLFNFLELPKNEAKSIGEIAKSPFKPLNLSASSSDSDDLQQLEHDEQPMANNSPAQVILQPASEPVDLPLSIIGGRTIDSEEAHEDPLNVSTCSTSSTSSNRSTSSTSSKSSSCSTCSTCSTSSSSSSSNSSSSSSKTSSSNSSSDDSESSNSSNSSSSDDEKAPTSIPDIPKPPCEPITIKKIQDPVASKTLNSNIRKSTVARRGRAVLNPLARGIRTRKTIVEKAQTLIQDIPKSPCEPITLKKIQHPVASNTLKANNRKNTVARRGRVVMNPLSRGIRTTKTIVPTQVIAPQNVVTSRMQLIHGLYYKEISN